MGTSGISDQPGLSQDQVLGIQNEIRQAALDHLHARSADEALGHFHGDVIAVSNDRLFASFAALEKDVREYYGSLKQVDHASFGEMHIRVVNSNTASITATFRYSFTDVMDEKTELTGVWTALYVREDEIWKIRMRHESFHVQEV
jgi:hypothetical protein